LQASGNLNKKISSQGSGNLNKKISSQGSGNLNKKISSPFGGGRIKVGVPLAALVLVVLLVAGLAVYGTRDTASGPTESITARIGSMFDVSSAGFADRLSLWKSAVAMIKDRPILGWGPETFGTYFPGYRRMDLVEFERDVMMLDQPRYQNRPHSDILQQGVSAGVLGMLAYILMWAAVLWYATFGAAIKRLKHATHPLAPSSQGRGNLDKTSSQRQAKPDGIARACLPVGRSAETASSQRQTILPLALIAVGVVVLSYLSIKPLVADYYFDRGVSAFEASADAYGARDALESAITLNRNNSEYTNYGTVILTRAAVTSRDPDMASVYLVEAVQYGEDTLALNPDYPGYHYNLGNAEYYYSLLPGLAKSESDRALRTAVKEFETAVARDPLYLDYRMNLAMAYTAAGDTANAIEQLEYALRLKPGHPKATEKLKELKELKTKK
jgi:tetratricopeptide (TPR) repeat protein